MMMNEEGALIERALEEQTVIAREPSNYMKRHIAQQSSFLIPYTMNTRTNEPTLYIPFQTVSLFAPHIRVIASQCTYDTMKTIHFKGQHLLFMPYDNSEGFTETVREYHNVVKGSIFRYTWVLPDEHTRIPKQRLHDVFRCLAINTTKIAFAMDNNTLHDMRYWAKRNYPKKLKPKVNMQATKPIDTPTITYILNQTEGMRQDDYLDMLARRAEQVQRRREHTPYPRADTP